MKTKCTLLLIGIVLCLCNASLHAQINKKGGFSINFGPEMLAPEGSFNSTHRIGLGGSIKMEYAYGKHLSATLNTGFSSLPGRNFFDPVLLTKTKFTSLNALPLKAGSRYYLGNFYFAGEGGVVWLSGYAKGANALLSVGLGDKIKIGRNRIDISARQEVWFLPSGNLNMAVIRAAFEIAW
jgi:hypothetical protein